MFICLSSEKQHSGLQDYGIAIKLASKKLVQICLPENLGFFITNH
jgi:hypothetical protein